MVEKLRNELLNKKMSFLELDNYMMYQGFYSVYDDGVTVNIKDDLSVVYTSRETNEVEILIHFEITMDNGEDEAPEAFYLKINNIKKY